MKLPMILLWKVTSAPVALLSKGQGECPRFPGSLCETVSNSSLKFYLQYIIGVKCILGQ